MALESTPKDTDLLSNLQSQETSRPEWEAIAEIAAALQKLAFAHGARGNYISRIPHSSSIPTTPSTPVPLQAAILILKGT
jgi:hypothetical protein